MFAMTIKDPKTGEILAQGKGKKFEPTLRRLYRKTGRPYGYCGYTDKYLPPADGAMAPYGVHQVQFGKRLPNSKGGGYAMADMVIVHVAVECLDCNEVLLDFDREDDDDE